MLCPSLNIRDSVFVLTKSKPLVGLIAVLSLLGFIFGMYAGIRSGIVRVYVPLLNLPLVYPFKLNAQHRQLRRAKALRDMLARIPDKCRSPHHWSVLSVLLSVLVSSVFICSFFDICSQSLANWFPQN